MLGTEGNLMKHSGKYHPGRHLYRVTALDLLSMPWKEHENDEKDAGIRCGTKSIFGHFDSSMQ